jgi:hypothetical protein
MAFVALAALTACSHDGTSEEPQTGTAGSRASAAGSTGQTAGSSSTPPRGAAGGSAGSGSAGKSAVGSGGAGKSASTAGTGAVSGDAGKSAEAGSAAGEAAAAGAGGAQSGQPDPDAMDLIAAPDGTDAAAGTLTEPTTLTAALKRVAAGHTIFLRDGMYTYDVQITIELTNSGTSKDQPKQLRAYHDEKPILDFSKQPYGTDGNPRGLQVNGNFWHVQGLTVQGSADNGIYVAGSHNVIEDCVTHGNRDTGLQIGRAGSTQVQADWPADNLILNCESYDNYDAPPGSGENADGFAAKLTVGEGNVFRGCESHNNIDDGWDLYTKTDTGPIGAVTIDQCIAHHNGTLTSGMTNEQGDRNGFKLGGEKIAVAHVVTRSVAFSNGKNGFTWNSNPGAIRLSNTLAFDNAEGNYNFGDSSTMTKAVFTNNVSLWVQASAAKSDKTMGTDASQTNCWWSTSGTAGSKSAKGLTVTTADFASPLDKAKIARLADHSLDFTPFQLAAGSDLVNAGVLPAGDLPFDASAYKGNPDLGAVETQ